MMMYFRRKKQKVKTEIKQRRDISICLLFWIYRMKVTSWKWYLAKSHGYPYLYWLNGVTALLECKFPC